MNTKKLTTIDDIKELIEALAEQLEGMRANKTDLMSAADMSSADDLPQGLREVAETCLSETQRHLDILGHQINHAISMCHQSRIVLDAYSQGVYTQDEAIAEVRRMWRADDND